MTFDESVKHGPTNSGVNELLLKRWSPRAFSDKQIADADLKKIFTAGAWAASSFNEQPWRFIVGKKGTPTHDKIFKTLMETNQAWAGAAPVLYASFAKKTFSHNGSPNRVAMHDVGGACANISLQATALGLHTHGMAGFDAKALAQEFAVPDDFEPIAVWAVGYLGDADKLPEKLQNAESAPRQRKELSAFVFEGWEKPAAL